METTIYVRISEDKDGKCLGVERQEKECRQLAESKGLTVREVLSDNDISAWNGKARPGFQALLASNPESIVVWHTDRLVRQPRDLETVINLGVNVFAVQAGDLDLSTPTGRAMARTIVAWANHENELKSARQKSAARQRAQAGKSWWPWRPFGFEMDGSLREDEATALQEAYTDLLSGVPLAVLAKRLNEAGLLTNRGKPWTGMTLRPLLLNPRNCGIRTYDGKEVGPAAWQAIVHVDTFRAAVDLLGDPKRSTGGGGRIPRNLLTGIAVCGVCGGQVKIANRQGYKVYLCRKGFCVSHRQEPLERYVSDQVKKFLYRQDVSEVFDDGDDQRRAEAKQKAKELQAQLDEAIEEANALRLTAKTLGRIEAALEPQIDEQLRLARSTAIPKKIVEVVEYPEMWEESLDMELRRSMIQSFFTVELLPVGRGVRKFKIENVVRLASPRTGRIWNSSLGEFVAVPEGQAA